MGFSPFTVLQLTLLLFYPICEGHFLFQQAVATNKGSSISSFFTFAELPGIENVKNEAMAKMAYDKGIEVHYVDVTNGGESEHPTTKLQDKSITANLHVSENLPTSYVLEGYCEWGIWSEGGRSPSLLRYYTSASHARGKEDYVTVNAASENIFRIDIQITHHTQKCIGQGTQDHQSVCVQLTVLFDGSPVPGANVTISHGDSNSAKPLHIVSDEKGVCNLSIPKADSRIFARANHNVNSPGGVTSNDENYDVVSNWATAVLELSSHLQKYPLETASDLPVADSSKTITTQTERSDQHHGNTTDNISFGKLMLLVLVTFFGSFLGSLAYENVCYSSQGYSRASEISGNVEICYPGLEKSEAC